MRSIYPIYTKRSVKIYPAHILILLSLSGARGNLLSVHLHISAAQSCTANQSSATVTMHIKKKSYIPRFFFLQMPHLSFQIVKRSGTVLKRQKNAGTASLPEG